MAEPTTSGQGEKKKREFVMTEGMDIVTGTKAHTNYGDTLIHLLKGYVGTGIFAMGDAFKNSGYVLGPICLTFMAIMNVHCQHILLKCAGKIAEKEEVEVKPSYGETSIYTFSEGPASLQKFANCMGHLTNIFLYFSELAFCSVYFLFVADHIQQIAGFYGLHFGTHEVLAIILAPMWLLTFLGNLKMLMPISLTANILIWMAIAIVFYFTTMNLGPITERNSIVNNYGKLPLFFGTALYAFEGITFIIPLRNEMKNPKDFVAWYGVLNVGILLVSIMYYTVGFLSYWKYGDDVRASVFLNFPTDNILAQCVKLLITLGVMLTFALHMYVPFEITYPPFHARFGPFKYPRLWILLFKSLLVLVTFFAANVIPFLDLFISLMGSLSVATLTFIIPPILHLVAFRGEQRVISIIKDVAIISIGFLGLITGTGLSVYEIFKAMQDAYSTHPATTAATTTIA